MEDRILNNSNVTVDAGALMSPRTRRRQRGPGPRADPSPLANVTAAPAMTNATVLTPELLHQLNPILVDALRGQMSNQGRGPSADEMIIQARGRRRLPLTFSPDVHSNAANARQLKMNALAQSSSNSSPTRRLARLLLPTRTSPRKRLTLTDSPPRTTGSSPDSSNVQTPKPSSPQSKKSRGLEPSDSPVTASPPSVLVKGLSQSQLAELFNKILEKHPDLNDEIGQMLPPPDLKAIEERLTYLKKNIFKALPNTRLESRTDSMSFNRVSIHLMALKKAILEEGKQLLEAEQYPALLDFVVMAWHCVKSTPIWDNPPHNNIRKQTFKALAGYCMQALKKNHWEPQALQDIKNRLQPLVKDSDDIQPCIRHLDSMCQTQTSA